MDFSRFGHFSNSCESCSWDYVGLCGRGRKNIRWVQTARFWDSERFLSKVDSFEQLDQSFRLMPKLSKKFQHWTWRNLTHVFRIHRKLAHKSKLVKRTRSLQWVHIRDIIDATTETARAHTNFPTPPHAHTHHYTPPPHHNTPFDELSTFMILYSLVRFSCFPASVSAFILTFENHYFRFTITLSRVYHLVLEKEKILSSTRRPFCLRIFSSHRGKKIFHTTPLSNKSSVSPREVFGRNSTFWLSVEHP